MNLKRSHTAVLSLLAGCGFALLYGRGTSAWVLGLYAVLFLGFLTAAAVTEFRTWRVPSWESALTTWDLVCAVTLAYACYYTLLHTTDLPWYLNGLWGFTFGSWGWRVTATASALLLKLRR